MDKLDEEIRKFFLDQESRRELGSRDGGIPTAEEFHLYLDGKLQEDRLDAMLSFLKANPDWQEWVIKMRGMGEELEKVWEQVEIPQEVIQGVKSAMTLKESAAPCPHCGKAITPFKRPISRQRLWVAFWSMGASISFMVSFVVSRYFFQFLVLTILFGVKAITDHRSAKMQILIYKALNEDDATGATNRLHKHSTHL